MVDQVGPHEGVLSQRPDETHDQLALSPTGRHRLQEIDVKIDGITNHLPVLSEIQRSFELVGGKPVGGDIVRQPS